MTVEILKLCAAAVICAFICFILKEFIPSFTSITAVCGVVLIFAFAVNGISQIMDFVLEIEALSPSNSNISIVAKAFSVMLLSELSADICIRAGEEPLAKALTFAGRIEIIIISLPVFRVITETALGLCG